MNHTQLVNLIMSTMEAICDTKRELTSHSEGYHADPDKADDTTTTLKKRLTTLKEVRDKLEDLL